ncbi:MAG: extracellular solute-binding protein [Anaerolineales bacterium]|nr:extracellular solute-binding protein [Anaerolineales bacterium]MCX7755310.1 extracellular solute-binding protein [Anaerolineales bacterium]
MRKTLFALLSVLVLASLVLSACGGGAATPAPASNEQPAPTKAPEQPAPTKAPEQPAGESKVLKIYLLDYTPATIEWLKSEINPAFEAKFPGVKVEITEGSWSGWDTTFSGFFAAGQGPDIINLGSEMNTLYGESLADMEPYLGEAAWPDIKNFGPALENAKYEGKIRGLPIFTAPRYVFCRTDLMQAAGWTSGTPKNFAEWVDFAKKLTVIDPATNSLKQQALVPVDAGSMADWQWWLLVFYSLGGQLYKADGSPNFDSPEALATTKFLYDMRVATYGPAANAVGSLPTGQGSVIDRDDATGKDNGAVCLAHSGWAAPAFDRPIWKDISIEPFYGDPANFPNSRPVVLAFNDWLAVPEYSPNKELAAEWLKLAFSKEANHKWNETMGLIPARNDAQYGFVTESPQLKREAELAAKYGVGFAGIKEAAKLSTIMQDALGKLITEELTVEQVNAKIQSEYSAALKK